MSEEIQISKMTDEVIVYQSADNAVRLEVQLAEESVWLSQRQMAQLFDTTPQNITLHIGNVYREQELTQSATCKDFLQVQIEGGKEKRRLTKFYNLDVIISVGYRVKSKRDESVLTMMSEKAHGVQVDIYTKDVTKALQLSGDKFNSQYGNLSIHQTNRVHDRFLIIDDHTIYLIGASLKDAGKRLFAFTKMSTEHIEELKKLL